VSDRAVIEIHLGLATRLRSQGTLHIPLPDLASNKCFAYMDPMRPLRHGEQGVGLTLGLRKKSGLLGMQLQKRLQEKAEIK